MYRLYFLNKGAYEFIGERSSEQDCNELAASYNVNEFRIEFQHDAGSMIIFDNINTQGV